MIPLNGQLNGFYCTSLTEEQFLFEHNLENYSKAVSLQDDLPNTEFSINDRGLLLRTSIVYYATWIVILKTLCNQLLLIWNSSL